MKRKIDTRERMVELALEFCETEQRRSAANARLHFNCEHAINEPEVGISDPPCVWGSWLDQDAWCENCKANRTALNDRARAVKDRRSVVMKMRRLAVKL